MVRVFLSMFMKPFFNPIFSHVRAPIFYSNVHPQRFFATYKDLHKETFTFASKCYYFNLREDPDNKDVFIVITEVCHFQAHSYMWVPWARCPSKWKMKIFPNDPLYVFARNLKKSRSPLRFKKSEF